jgi:hypothetical protein
VPGRRERAAFDDDAAPRTVGPEETHHHQVQVHGQRVHRDDFVRLRPDEAGERFAHELVVRHPRAPRAEMAVDREVAPVFEFLGHDRRSALRLQAERIAAEVRELVAGRVARVVEPGAGV